MIGRLPVIDTQPAQLYAVLERCAPPLLSVDVEPALAMWNSSQADLSGGPRRSSGAARVSDNRQPRLILTNSARRATALPAGWHQRQRVQKPWTSRLGLGDGRVVVIGDQSLHDGMLAWRVSAMFVRVRPPARQPRYPAAVEGIMRPLALTYHRPTPMAENR